MKAKLTLEFAFNTKVGLSDHTEGYSAPCGAVALGASIIEKHFILDRKLGGVDSTFSMEPPEFKEMVRNVRQLEEALGSPAMVTNDAVEKRRERGRSLFAVKDIKTGEKFTEENVKSIRPGYGLHPKELKNVYGKEAKVDIEKGMPLDWKLINK